jgi:hypothetical protein
MADHIYTDAMRRHFGIPSAPQTQELDAIGRLCDEVDRLRAEVAQLDAICRWNREHVTTVVDEEFGFRVGGMGCEHPSLTGDRCDACGWTEEWEADL